LLIGLGAQGRLQHPVQQQGRMRRHTIWSRLPVVGDGGDDGTAGRRLPPRVDRTAPTYNVGWGGREGAMAKACAANTFGRTANSWPPCLLANTFAANAVACAAASWQWCLLSATANSCTANALACAATSWQRCSAAASANAITRTDKSASSTQQSCLVALLIAAFARAAAAC
jgi:hypothetical protein